MGKLYSLPFFLYAANYKYYNLTLNHTLTIREDLCTNDDVPKRGFREFLSGLAKFWV